MIINKKTKKWRAENSSIRLESLGVYSSTSLHGYAQP